MGLFFHDEEIFGPRGPSGPDGNPIGTVISFMGTTAPEDYLVCDGSAHNIADFPALAAFFDTQFGSKNHFGGNGTTTFAVPDLRNLFLRGYYGDAEEKLSGEIGEKQDATEHVNIAFDSSNSFIYWGSGLRTVIAPDSESQLRSNTGPFIRQTSTGSMGGSVYYTSRPVNMAVLYCIKAVESVPVENMYLTEEQVINLILQYTQNTD